MAEQSSSGSRKLICTLTPDDRSEQEHDWVGLCSRATSIERRTDGATAWFPTSMASEVESLVAKEQACCGSWLELTLTRNDDSLQLAVAAATAQGVATIHEMLDR